MDKKLCTEEDLRLVKLYSDYDLGIEVDLLGWFFVTDPLHVFDSPSRYTVKELNDWLLENEPSVRKILDD